MSGAIALDLFDLFPPSDPHANTSPAVSAHRTEHTLSAHRTETGRAASGERIGGAALQALSEAALDARSVRLTSVLPREVYEEVNEALVRLGGKWKRQGPARDDGVPSGAHVFDYDPTPLLAALLEDGTLPPRNPTAFWPTPPELAREVAEAVGHDRYLNRPDVRLLEPSAGHGAIALPLRDLYPAARTECVEVLSLNARVLRREGFTVHEQDFLHFTPGAVYDAIAMNPPFSVDGDRHAYVTHVLHAWSFLKDGGVLAAIVPQSVVYRTDRRTTELRDLAMEHGGIDPLPDGSFAPSGTGVATCLLTLEKEQGTPWKRRPRAGFPSWHAWQADLWATNDSDLYPQKERIWKLLARERAALESGFPPATATVEQIHAYFRESERILRRLHTSIHLQGEDLAHLAGHFVQEYLNEARFRDADD